MLISTVQAPIELKPQYIYELSASNDLPSNLIPLATDHKIKHRYPKLLNIPILNAAHSRLYIPKSIAFKTMKPVEIENAEICEALWIKIENLSENTMKNL